MRRREGAQRNRPGVGRADEAMDDWPKERTRGDVGGIRKRTRGCRADKEKAKRMKGQSTHARWKSEAEMLLRQQYD